MFMFVSYRGSETIGTHARYEHDILLVASVILIMKDGEHKRMEKWDMNMIFYW